MNFLKKIVHQTQINQLKNRFKTNNLSRGQITLDVFSFVHYIHYVRIDFLCAFDIITVLVLK